MGDRHPERDARLRCLEIGVKTGATYGEPIHGPLVQCNGYHDRDWETRADPGNWRIRSCVRAPIPDEGEMLPGLNAGTGGPPNLPPPRLVSIMLIFSINYYWGWGILKFGLGNRHFRHPEKNNTHHGGQRDFATIATVFAVYSPVPAALPRRLVVSQSDRADRFGASSVSSAGELR